MNIQKPLFKQSGETRLYFLDTGAAPANPVFTAGFLASEGSSFGNELQVEAAWNDQGGVYIFLTTPPPDIRLFIQRVSALLKDPGYYNTRFLWVLDPSFATSPWAGNKLQAAPQPDFPGSWFIMQTEVFSFADYQFSIGAQSTVSGPSQDNLYGFTFYPAQGSSPNLFFYTPSTPYPMASPSMMLPLSGDTPGCFQCSFKLSNSGGAGNPSDFELMQIGCNYFIPDPEQASEGIVKTLNFPVLIQPPGDIMLYGCLDPLNQLLDSRTSLSLFDPAGKAPEPSQMDSWFVTATGYNVALTPLRGVNGEADSRFVFAKKPVWSDPSAVVSYYLTLDGGFTINASTHEAATASSLIPAQRLVCGISSVEYAGLMVKDGNVIHFIPGGKAYAPGQAPQSSNSSAQDTAPLLTDLGTASYVYITPPTEQNRIYYYAQPEQALMYDASNLDSVPDDDASGYLNYLEVPAAVLPPLLSSDLSHAFPMAPFHGIRSEDVDLCRQLEQQAISPSRRKIIEAICGYESGTDAVRGTAGNGNAIGVTPQGLVVEMDDNLIDWKRLALGNMANVPPQTGLDDLLTIDDGWLQLTEVTGPFRSALQSNQLFMVATSPDEFLKYCSVRYRLLDESFVRLRQLPAGQKIPDDILNTIAQRTREAGYPVYDDLTSYKNQLIEWNPQVQNYLDAFEKEGSYFEMVISGWKFLLSPYFWLDETRSSHKQTIMLLKFNHRPLDELIEDTGAWPWPEAAKTNGSLKNTRDEIRGIFDTAKGAVAEATDNNTVSPYQNFVENIITNSDWNGVLFLNAQVPLDRLPEQLQGISVGIDSNKFYAHHVGLSITPLSIQQQKVQLGATSLFGLIDYQDPDDLIFSENTEFDFKVLSLTVLFENSCIKAFSSKIELLICKLFGGLVLLRDGLHGNNLILEGVCQSDKGQNFYSFRQAGENLYQSENSILDTIEVLSSRFVTLTSGSSEETESGLVHTEFNLGGKLFFTEIENFDLFSFGPALPDEDKDPDTNGYLSFCDLTIGMSFNSLDSEPEKAFSVKASGISFDITQSLCRDNGLYKKFPLTLTGMVESLAVSTEGDTPKGVSPKEMGYTAIGAPLNPVELNYPWYGLSMDLDLGTLGSLAGNLGLKITLLAAWSSSDPNTEKPLYIGMKFPGLADLGVKLPIEGILSLGFRNIQFLSNNSDSQRQYMLRLRQFGIRLLGLSFPPGNNDIYLFGNPDGSSITKLGWYAAYSDGKKYEEENITRRMQSGRRNRIGGES